MRKLPAIQLAVIGAAVLITVLLSFVHTWPAEGKSPKSAMVDPANKASIEPLIRTIKSALNPELQRAVAVIEGSVPSERDANKRGQLYDSLIHLLVLQKQNVLAAYFAEQKAVKNNGKSVDWEQAGERYRNAAAFEENENNFPLLISAAQRCFNKALELDPENPDAKVGIAICTVESGGDPMTGIKMLLEVAEKDSNNVNAQLALGDFSIKRNAPDKAIVRYKNALRIKPEYYGLHLSIADLYVQVGDTASAIEHLKAYVDKETDPLVKNDVENAIRKLSRRPPKP